MIEVLCVFSAITSKALISPISFKERKWYMENLCQTNAFVGGRLLQKSLPKMHILKLSVAEKAMEL